MRRTIEPIKCSESSDENRRARPSPAARSIRVRPPLAIVKSIRERHRGKVEIASRDGRTTFAQYFPRGTGSQVMRRRVRR
ncbi:hypothetical protein CFB46_21295 [Burkholderia sp. HI2761]|nr:hypothetical protein [Burkholderia sp. BE24]OXJ23425.1 hypothetical protein CFB46_21295 [Burkholderia sp. HI2761]